MRPQVLAATGSRATCVTPGLIKKLDRFLTGRAKAYDLSVILGVAEDWDELVARQLHGASNA